MAFHRGWLVLEAIRYDLVALSVMLESEVPDNIPATVSIDLHTLATNT